MNQLNLCQSLKLIISKKKIKLIKNESNHPSLSIFLKAKGYTARIINVDKKCTMHLTKSVFPASFGIATKSNANNMIAPANLTIASRLLLGSSKLTYFSSKRKPNEIPKINATYLI